ncbi:MAG: hypothetical protein MJ207_01680 [Bacilli bacterium]|nr:hypothetical protein [Bacilli bacterium]
MHKQKLIPLASMSALLFSCGGAKTIKVDSYSVVEEYILTLRSEKTDFVKGTKYNFEIDLSKMDQIGSHVNGFLVGEMSESGEPKGYEIFDEGSISVLYNGEKLTKSKYTMEEYMEKIDDDPTLEKTFNFGSAEGEGSNTFLISFCLYSLKVKDKLSISAVCDKDQSSVQAIYTNIKPQ